MSRTSTFSSPLLLGFEEMERLLERVAKTASDTYPPYNIEQADADTLRITVAVAGFTRDALSVTVEDNQLVIRGRQAEEGERVFLHRGIAMRQFQRSFVLADSIEVEKAYMDNGLLVVDLKRVRPQKATRRVEIKAGATGGNSGENVKSEKVTSGSVFAIGGRRQAE